jgi:hypothetical protein
MADLKISQLTGASTPLAGTEVLPIVQSGTTVKVSVANLTTGRAVAMAGGSFTDNITQSTAAKGVNFTANTPAAGMTSQLLNWYEEGTWTTTVSGISNFTGTPTLDSGKYTKVGRLVTIEGKFSATVTTGSTNAYFEFTLPFSRSAGTDGGAGSVFSNAGLRLGGIYNASANTTTAYLVMPAPSAQGSGADVFFFSYSYNA